MKTTSIKKQSTKLTISNQEIDIKIFTYILKEKKMQYYSIKYRAMLNLVLEESSYIIKNLTWCH